MTYAGLAAIFLALSAVLLAVAVVRRRPGAAWWAATGLTAAALFVLTVVFDSLMIAADLFRYGEGAEPAFLLWKAPVEDLAWPLAAVLALPALWLLLSKEEDR
ncbi:lycopene cyclase domain-containing protein [Nocardioides marmotae]|uniref:Lycopene cyclase domain-containing protein n=1 Tax=Nocardioides marmotae TaxID=2663857 RepID=A0A6I3IZY1_9ACTN|nr:lycopene cyclase domain-containing protein [Nocardioides marmotae]MCR6030665.1 lycopene cyclase domain-containing protein [Gordonia jinghuaiqii]MBC9734151.1 lycopene cyclase domain-containing protein [Nocardioides marmotae]MTB85254.1 lycopene cyclase domain-containing protein [Nocardioides marmotae]MTB94301.1 lycopene cyclase domain-containing protein [Nocardioides marmotae]QKE00576.1 lycopene cyclase domain-containing protein [Nocardioides marmotae]